MRGCIPPSHSLYLYPHTCRCPYRTHRPHLCLLFGTAPCHHRRHTSSENKTTVNSTLRRSLGSHRLASASLATTETLRTLPLPPSPPNRRVRVGDRHAQKAGYGRAAAIDSASVTQRCLCLSYCWLTVAWWRMLRGGQTSRRGKIRRSACKTR